MSVTATDREASAMTVLCQGSIDWADGMLMSSDFSDGQRDFSWAGFIGNKWALSMNSRD